MEKGKPVEIDQDLLAQLLEGVPKSVQTQERIYTATEDAFILAIWEKGLNKQIAAKKLNICEGTLRKRYNELKEKNK